MFLNMIVFENVPQDPGSQDPIFFQVWPSQMKIFIVYNWYLNQGSLSPKVIDRAVWGLPRLIEMGTLHLRWVTGRGVTHQICKDWNHRQFTTSRSRTLEIVARGFNPDIIYEGPPWKICNLSINLCSSDVLKLIGWMFLPGSCELVVDHSLCVGVEQLVITWEAPEKISPIMMIGGVLHESGHTR